MNSSVQAVSETTFETEIESGQRSFSMDAAQVSCDGNEGTEAKTQLVPALVRALRLLEYLAQSENGVTHSHLTRRLRLPRSTCHALLHTFERYGYMERDVETGRYCFGAKLYAMANKAPFGIHLRKVAAPVLSELARRTGLSAGLAVLVDGQAVLIERMEPPGTQAPRGWRARNIRLHCTALGKALIAYLPEERALELVQKHGLQRHNENTIYSTRKLILTCEAVRRMGYALDNEEEEIGMRSIGAPVFDSRQEVAAALSISGATAQLENVSSLALQVRRAATELGRRLGSPCC